MTALKPIENLRVRAVASERYPLNEVCAHPECAEPAVDPHHIFPRSLIAGDSWFVAIYETVTMEEMVRGRKLPANGDHVTIPHVSGLCRAHHDDVEEHRAWIKLEDGVFVWYDRVELRHTVVETDWKALGPLNPQPGSKTGKPKRRRHKGEKRRQRATISIKVPKDDQEDGGEVWDDLFGDGQEDRPYGRVREKFDALDLDGGRPPYNLIVDMANDWLNG